MATTSSNLTNDSFPQYESTPLNSRVPDWNTLPPFDTKAKNCQSCQAPFGFSRWRHYCAGCHATFCSDHCYHYILFEDWKELKPELVCNGCQEKYSNLDYSRKYDAYMPESYKKGDEFPPTIISTHGATGHRNNHIVQAQSWAKAGYRVITMDLPGHGSRYNETLTPDSCCAAIMEIYEREIPSRRAILFGHSMGAYAVHLFAFRYPELVSGFVQGGAMINYHGKRSGALGVMGVLYNKILPNSTLSTIIQKSFKFDPKTLAVHILRSGCFWKAWDGVVDVMCALEQMESLPKLDMPILFLIGEKDFHNDEKALVAAAKKGTLYTVAGGEHVCCMTHIDEYNKACLDWFLTTDMPAPVPSSTADLQ